MKKYWILGFVLLVFWGCATKRKNVSSIAKVMGNTESKEDYTIVTDIYPPFCYMGNNGPAGQDVEILKKLADNMGVNFNFKFMDWGDAVEKTTQGNYDGIFTLSMTKKREKDFYFPSINISLDEIGIFANPSFRGEIRNLSDLEGTKIGFVKGTQYSEEFENYKGCQKIKAKSYDQLFEWLIRGQVELAILGLKPANYFLEYKALTKFKSFEGIIKRIKVMPIILQADPMYIAIPKNLKNGKNFYKRIENALLKMQDDGEIFRIRQKYN